jgi:hypothetical protein
MPRYILSANAAYFNLLFASLNLHDAGIVSQIWSLLQRLPTNPDLFSSLHSLERVRNSSSEWDTLLDSRHINQLLYSLQILETLTEPSEESEEERANRLPERIAWRKNFLLFGGFQHLYRTLVARSNICDDAVSAASGQSLQLSKMCMALLVKMLSNTMIPALTATSPTLMTDILAKIKKISDELNDKKDNKDNKDNKSTPASGGVDGKEAKEKEIKSKTAVDAATPTSSSSSSSSSSTPATSSSSSSAAATTTAAAATTSSPAPTTAPDTPAAVASSTTTSPSPSPPLPTTAAAAATVTSSSASELKTEEKPPGPPSLAPSTATAAAASGTDERKSLGVLEYTALVRQVSTGMAGRLLDGVKMDELQSTLISIIHASATAKNTIPLDHQIVESSIVLWLAASLYSPDTILPALYQVLHPSYHHII